MNLSRFGFVVIVLLAAAGPFLTHGQDRKPATAAPLVAGNVAQVDEGPNKKPTTDWSIFRGNPAQTGVGHANLPDQLKVRWKFEVKQGIDNAAAIVDGVVYCGALDEHFYALDLKTGKELWKYKAGPFKAPPSIKNGRVYVGDEDGMFHCIDAKTGLKVWTFETTSEIVSGAGFAGDNLIFGSYDSTLYCLDKDGKEVWKYKVDGPVNGTPAIAGNRTFVAGCDSALHIIDTTNGKKIASVDLGSQAAATPAVLGDHVFVGTMGCQVVAIDLKKNEIAWTFEADERAQAFYASAAVTDKLVVVGSRDKIVYALDHQNKGKVAWKFPTKGRIDGSAVVVGQRVYAPSLDGNLYVLDLANGQQHQKLELGRMAASPAVGGDCLVIGTTDGVLYCLGKKD